MENLRTLLLLDLWLLRCNKKFQNLMISGELELPKKKPGDEFLKLRKSKLWESQFFSVVTFKWIFGIPLLINLLKELGCEFKIDKKNPTQSRSAEQRITLPKISLNCIFNQHHNVGWFLLRRFVDLLRVCALHIISRNHSNTFLLINQ